MAQPTSANSQQNTDLAKRISKVPSRVDARLMQRDMTLKDSDASAIRTNPSPSRPPPSALDWFMRKESK